MQEEEIKGYIDRLNNDEFEETIFLRQISRSVEIARVWEKEPELNNDKSIESLSNRFFFIKNENDRYVGAVLDMYRDLHWYIIEEERRVGHLTKALQEAIIPYLFTDEDEEYEREVQRITIDFGRGKTNYLNSKNVAERLGFKPVNQEGTEFELNKDKFDWQYEDIRETNGTISKERFNELRNRLLLSYRQLIKISDELVMTYENDMELRNTALEVSYFKLKIEDIEWENEKR